MSQSVLKALPGRLDINRHSPSILLLYKIIFAVSFVDQPSFIFSVLYFVLHHDRARAENGTTDCPEAPCPYIRITLLGGTASDSDCRQRLYTEEQYNISIPVIILNYIDLE